MLVTNILEGAINAFGIRTGETPKYEIVVEDGELEIRRYSAFLVAKYFVAGSYPECTELAFQRLADFINGNNVDRSKLDPQEAQARGGGEHMPMTTPILQWQAAGGWTMAFVLPRKYTFSTSPRPTDEGVELQQMPSQTMAVLRYTGGVDEERILRRFRELQGWVQSIGWRSISEPVAAQYDPPFTIPFLKRNEVLVRAEALHS
jgi:hypothetical protein